MKHLPNLLACTLCAITISACHTPAQPTTNQAQKSQDALDALAQEHLDTWQNLENPYGYDLNFYGDFSSVTYVVDGENQLIENVDGHLYLSRGKYTPQHIAHTEVMGWNSIDGEAAIKKGQIVFACRLEIISNDDPIELFLEQDPPEGAAGGRAYFGSGFVPKLDYLWESNQISHFCSHIENAAIELTETFDDPDAAHRTSQHQGYMVCWFEWNAEDEAWVFEDQYWLAQ